MSRKKKSATWSFSAGSYGRRTRVYEREPGGVLYAAIPDTDTGRYRRVSLGHRDRDAAEQFALDTAKTLTAGDRVKPSREPDTLTVARLFALYRRHKTPDKSPGQQGEDVRRIEMWTRVLKAQTDPSTISVREWDAFKRDRRSGKLDSRGQRVELEERKPVGARTVEADLLWLRWTLNWVKLYRDADGNRLLSENPTDGLTLPQEKNPTRPVATQDRLDVLLQVADDVTMEIRWHGKREKARSYLRELLAVANGTGRRVRAICSLQWSDVDFTVTDARPYGQIQWPCDTDKEGRDWAAPIGPEVRDALLRLKGERGGIGNAPVFPSPKDPGKPISRHLADDWLRKAEMLAGLEPQKGGAWHPYRRKWATERKHLPDVDVAKAGGWASVEALRACYTQPDEKTILLVVLDRRELREAR